MKLFKRSICKVNHKTAILIIFFVLFLDQASKIYIKLHYPLSMYGEPAIVDWGFFKLLMIENKGMAWGTKISDILPFIGEEIGKLILTLFRLAAIVFLEITNAC